jgi:hypothetical protein
MVDSLLSGCIPVVFHIEALHTLWPLHLEFSEAIAMSVYYPIEQQEQGREKGLEDVDDFSLLFAWLLKNRNSDETILKRHAISTVARKLQYSLPIDEYLRTDREPDAFDKLLEKLTLLTTYTGNPKK